MGGQRSAIHQQLERHSVRGCLVQAGQQLPVRASPRPADDASQRFERGVDWRGQERALALATRLLLESPAVSPVRSRSPNCGRAAANPPVTLRSRQLQRLLGQSIAAADVELRLRAWQWACARTRAAGAYNHPVALDIEIEPD